jgi:ParB family chromosome partitioning protein
MTPTEIERAAREQTARVKEARRALKKRRGRPSTATAPPKTKRTLRAFVYTWADLAHWPDEWDAAEIGAGLDDEQWAMFETVMVDGDRFFADSRVARMEAGLLAAD